MNFKRFLIFMASTLVLTAAVLGLTAFRSVAVYNDVTEIRDHVKYLVETGDSISTESAETALSSAYLEIIFGDNPQLLEQLLGIIDQGMVDAPDMNLGEVAAIIVTYRKNDQGDVEEVVAHIIGEFPLGRRTVNMHPSGYMANRMDENLWNSKRAAINFLGRDIAVWAKDDQVERPQQEIVEAIFAGEVLLVADSIATKPLYFTAVFPAPRDLLPMRMRPHVRAILYNGYMEPAGGKMEIVALCNNERSAQRALAMFHDVLDSAQVGLRARFGGTVTETAWDKEYVESWWAYELANTIQDLDIVQNDQTISISSEYGRVMVNAIMKIIERFGRDYTAIRGVQEEKNLPPDVQEFMKGNPYTPRWTEAHKWGPDWPFPPPNKVDVQRPAELKAREGT